MANLYAEDERLPNECVQLALQPGSLPILLKGFIKKIFKVVITEDISREIMLLCDAIYLNDELSIVYDRVGRIQKFIHKFAVVEYGFNAHHKLPHRLMRNLLSTARLHLNIMDMKYREANDLFYIFRKSKEMSDLERVNPQPAFIPEGKRFIKNWKTIHLMPLLQYQETSMVDKVIAILSINDEDYEKEGGVDEVKELMIDIYCGKKNYIVEEKDDWRQTGRWCKPEDSWEWR